MGVLRERNKRAMRPTATVAALGLAAALMLGACSGDSDSAAPTTQRDSGNQVQKSTTTLPPDTAPSTTLDDRGYSVFFANTLAKLNAAGTDTCKVALVFRDVNSAPAPVNAAQGRQAIDLAARLFTSVADSAGPAQAAAAADLRAGVAAVEAAAKKNGYAPDWIVQNASTTLGEKAFAALQTLVTANDAKCRQGGG